MKIYVFWLNFTEIAFLMSKWSTRCWTVDSNKKIIEKYYNRIPAWLLFKITWIDLKMSYALDFRDFCMGVFLIDLMCVSFQG